MYISPVLAVFEMLYLQNNNPRFFVIETLIFGKFIYNFPDYRETKNDAGGTIPIDKHR